VRRSATDFPRARARDSAPIFTGSTGAVISAGSDDSSSAPAIAMSRPATTRSVLRRTSSAFFTNGPVASDAVTPGAGPIQTAKDRTLSPGSSSGSSSTVPATQPRSGGDARTTTSSFGAAVPRANVRPFSVMR
jgi:hypothetical protein